jgi:autotransporter-associated beta strand protein
MTISTGTTTLNDFWKGSTIVEQGTLSVDDPLLTNDGELRSATIDVRAGATFDVSSFGTAYSLQIFDNGADLNPFTPDDIGQNVRGAGTINTGSSTLQAFEESSFTPGDSTGTLSINGQVTMNQSAPNTTAGLNFELSNVTTVGGGVNDLIAVNGNLALQASNGGTFKLKVTPINGQLSTSPYTIMTRTTNTGDSVSPSDFVISIVNAQGVPLNTRLDDGASVAINPTTVTATFSAAQSYNWTGAAANGLWDINGSANWSSSDNRYFDLDHVTFVDGTGQTSVTVAANVTPGSVTFNNSADTFTFSGNGGIQTLTGGTMAINAGADVVLNNVGNSIGGSLNLAATATLQHGDGVTANTYAISGPVSNAGAISLASGTLNVSGAVNHSGSIAVSAGTLNLSGVVSGGGSITTTGGGTVISGNNTLYTGQINVNAGSVEINNANALGSAAGSTVVAEGATLQSFGDAFTVPEAITLNGGAIRIGGGGPAATVFSGNVTLGAGESNVQLDGGTGDDGMAFSGNIAGSSGGTFVVGVDGGSRVLVTGSIQHNGSLTKNSNGEIELQGANTYSGGTTLNGGTLDLETASATLGTGNVLVNGGTLDISSGVANAIANSAQLSIAGGLVNLGAGINEIIGSLLLGGVPQAAGTYGAVGSGATNQDNTYFSGTGILTIGLTGDYNSDGVVDAADFVMWRKTNPGNIAMYNDWRQNFGSSLSGSGGNALGGGGNASVPEPTTASLLCLCSIALLAARRRNQTWSNRDQ